MPPIWHKLTLGILLLLFACSKPDAAPQAMAKQQGTPALWKVAAPGGKGGVAYLFGTVHMLPANVEWQSGALDAAIQASDKLVIEVLGLENRSATSLIFHSMGRQTGLPPLASRVAAPLRQKLFAAADPVPGPLSALDDMESWAAALMIAANSPGVTGVDQSRGVESVLQLRFGAQDKPVSGLESTSQQFGFFDTLPESQQRIMLTQVALTAGNAQQEYQALLADWLEGRVDALVESANKGLLASPQLRAVLLDNRNKDWTTKIAGMIDKGEHPFAAVGAGHLGGAGGVPALLKAQGYTVERVQ